MKLIIEHGRVKREINGAFNICGDPRDLESLARQILGYFAVNPERGYGWVTILPRDEQRSVANTPPISWEEGADRSSVRY